jgi:AraC-like DNA-binding protein
MDVLSDTLQVVRLTGAIFLNAALAEPWAVESATPRELAQYLRLSSDCIALFHVLVQGQCWFAVPGYAPVLLRSGDAILLPQSAPHTMRSGHRAILVPMSSVLPPLPPGEIVTIHAGGSGEITNFICGFLHCDQRFNPLIGALPPLIVIRLRQNEDEDEEPSGRTAAASAAVLRVQEGGWLEGTLRHLVEEARGEWPGNIEMLARLSEILFVEVVRHFMRQLPEAHQGWLAGVRDPIVGQTLRLLHAHPERAWTVEELAYEVAVARSTLAQRFTTLVGEAPMRYLARWRMQVAKHLLKQPNMRLAEVATRVGYDSEAAFSRAFRRHVGCPPDAWRMNGDDR